MQTTERPAAELLIVDIIVEVVVESHVLKLATLLPHFATQKGKICHPRCAGACVLAQNVHGISAEAAGEATGLGNALRIMPGPMVCRAWDHGGGPDDVRIVEEKDATGAVQQIASTKPSSMTRAAVSIISFGLSLSGLRRRSRNKTLLLQPTARTCGQDESRLRRPFRQIYDRLHLELRHCG